MTVGGPAHGAPPKKNPEEQESVEPGWAPNAPTDGRLQYEWQSRWPDAARKEMRREACLIAINFGLGLWGVWYAIFQLSPASVSLTFGAFLLAAAAAGMLGGTAFAIKWFYHVIARGLWHMDRRYWRIFVPYSSSLLAVVTALAVLGSEVADGKDHPRLGMVVKTLLVAFLAGYFSDAASAKLADVAKVLFGVTEKHKLPQGEGEHKDTKPKLEN